MISNMPKQFISVFYEDLHNDVTLIKEEMTRSYANETSNLDFFFFFLLTYNQILILIYLNIMLNALLKAFIPNGSPHDSDPYWF